MSPQERRSFQEHGYVVLRAAIELARLAELGEVVDRLVAGALIEARTSAAKG